MSGTTKTRSRDGIGASASRPDGRLKVRGEFAYSSDLWADRMLWGATLRSPHPYARIEEIDLSAALALPGVFAVLTADDVPGSLLYGLELPDQPVLASEFVRYQGEPIAVVAADHPETARRATQLIEVSFDVYEPISDVDLATEPDQPQLHAKGNELKRIRVVHGDVEAAREQADIVIEGDYEVGMQDQAFLGPESGLAIPAEDGGVDLLIATQWLHADQRQMAACLDLPPEKVRLTLAGVGGAFGGREDLSMQIHASMLALHTDRPVKMVYSREESFFGHVHRHPARLHYEHGATSDGDLVYVKASIRFDGGAYASSSMAVCVNGASTAAGPYECPNAEFDCFVAYTNNPPCGAMRGFGAVQTCFAYEAQMDKLAAAVGISPVELRLRNAMSVGTVMPTGQKIDTPAPVEQLLSDLAAMPLPPEAAAVRGPHELPGGVANTTRGEDVRRGIGYAVGWKNVGFSGGFDDYSTARVKISTFDSEPQVEVHTACCEVGQGGTTVHQQIARTELGIDRVTVAPADTQIGNAGSSSASRQTWITGGAVRAACEAVREQVLQRLVDGLGPLPETLELREGQVLDSSGHSIISMAELIGGEPIEATREYRPRQTFPLDENGQGDAHISFAFAAHRAVVDVDVELGLVRVIEIATTQDVGKAINPQAIQGQIEGGIAQGLGLALMEEIQVTEGLVRNPSFTDYLIPTILDMPTVRAEILELPQPQAPYGLNGVGEPPTIASTAAIVAALRDATGRPLTRVPVRPEELVGLAADR